MIRTLREAILVLAALVLAVLLAYVLILLIPREVQSERVFVPSVYEDRLIELDTEAIEEAYKRHIMLLFDNWVKDMKAQQPARALTGADNARKAYEASMKEIDRRVEARKKR